MANPNYSDKLSGALATFVIEYLCALFGERDPEAIKAFLANEIVQRRGVDPETAWGWVAGRQSGVGSGELEPSPVGYATCDSCGQPMDNLTGMFVVRRDGRTQTVCPACVGGGEVVATARGIG
jgi:hypothetical protein